MLIIDNLNIAHDGFKKCYNVHIENGNIALLLGPSGSGKTTLLHAIAGFITPISGDIRWQNQSLLPLLVEQRPVALQFQNHNLFEHLSIKQNIQLTNNLPETVLLEHATHLGIANHWHKKPHQLSGGQQKRVALLRSMCRIEPLILLDEPFAQLDEATHIHCRNWVEQQARLQQKTLLLVSHQSSDQNIADTTIHLDE